MFSITLSNADTDAHVTFQIEPVSGLGLRVHQEVERWKLSRIQRQMSLCNPGLELPSNVTFSFMLASYMYKASVSNR